jgi:hypothetical protein
MTHLAQPSPVGLFAFWVLQTVYGLRYEVSLLAGCMALGAGHNCSVHGYLPSATVISACPTVPQPLKNLWMGPTMALRSNLLMG